VGLYVIVYSHEMFHIIAGWRYGIPTRLITLSPLGGIAHMLAGMPSPRTEIVVALAGPMVHLIWLAVFALPYFLIDSGFYARFLLLFMWQVNLALMIFNLLPFFPMDGGRVLRALLALRMHPNRATALAARIGMGGGVVMAIWGFFDTSGFGVILVLIGVSVFFACRRELAMTRHTSGPYMSGDQLRPWETDGESWKLGATGGGYSGHGGAGGVRTAARQRRPGPLRRWLDRRRARKELHRQLEAKELRIAVDAILEKINEVGLSGITEEERQILLRASRGDAG